MNRPINEKICPLCGSPNVLKTYPIDLDYAAEMAGRTVDDEFSVAQCQTCCHQFICPSPSSNFLEAFYSSYMSAAKSGFYEARYSASIPNSFRNYYGQWLDKVLFLRQGSSGNLLDIGSGLGMFLRLAREKGFHVAGIEPNAEAVEYLAREYDIAVSNSLLENYIGTQQFDVVTMWDLLEHLADPRMALSKIKTILKPGGIMVLEIPVRDSILHWAAKIAYSLTLGVVKRPLYLTYGVHHLQYFSEKSIISFLAENGFETLDYVRSETDFEAVKRKPSVGLASRVKVTLFNGAIASLLTLARITGRRNKIVVFAKNNNE